MKISGCVAVIIGLIAPPALASSLTPAFAAGSGAPVSHRLGFAPLFSRPPGDGAVGRLDAGSDRALPALRTQDLAAADELSCSLQTLSEPELLAPPPAARSLLAGRGAAHRYPSLGGPALTLTSPDSLPGLRDPAAAPADPEDTLRLFRSHW